MKSQKIQAIRDITIIIGVIIFVIVFSVTNLYTMYQQYDSWKTFSKESSESPISAYASCDSYPEHHAAAIELANNGPEEVKEVKCKIIDAAGLASDSNEQVVENLSPGSTDMCGFILKGTPSKPFLRFEVSYNDVSFKTSCQLYPYEP